MLRNRHLDANVDGNILNTYSSIGKEHSVFFFCAAGKETFKKKKCSLDKRNL